MFCFEESRSSAAGDEYVPGMAVVCISLCLLLSRLNAVAL
jgi:hypothetical protein